MLFIIFYCKDEYANYVGILWNGGHKEEKKEGEREEERQRE
jgi:hypothetical protein